MLPSAQFSAYQEAVGWHIPHKHEMISERINLQCVYYMPTRHKVDLANLLSATCDILVHYGVIADDNANIVASHDGSRVDYDKANPRVEVTITTKESEV